MTRLTPPTCEIKCGMNMSNAFNNEKSLMNTVRSFRRVVAVN